MINSDKTLNENEEKIIQVAQEFIDFLRDYDISENVGNSASNTMELWNYDLDKYVEVMEKYLTDESGLYNYANRLEVIRKRNSNHFYGGMEFNPEGIDANQIENDAVLRLHHVLVESIDNLKKEMKINKTNIELYKIEREISKNQGNRIQEEIIQSGSLQRELREANEHINGAHQDIEDLRKELAQERQIFTDYQETQKNWYANQYPQEAQEIEDKGEAFEIGRLLHLLKQKQQQAQTEKVEEQKKLQKEINKIKNQLLQKFKQIAKREKQNKKLNHQLDRARVRIAAAKNQLQQFQQKMNSVPFDWQQQITNNNLEKIQAQIERDEAVKEKENYQVKLVKQEQKIVKQLNDSLQLGLNEDEKDLNKVISEIQRLINKPPFVITIPDEIIKEQFQEAQQTITTLKKQLSDSNQNYFSTKEQARKELEKELLYQIKQQLVSNLNTSISPKIKQAIEQATTYQQAINAHRQAYEHAGDWQAIKQQNITLTEQKTGLVKQQKSERIVLVSGLIVSLIVIGGLLIKMNKKI